MMYDSIAVNNSYSYKFKTTTRRKKVTQLSLPLRQSKYKWENIDNRTKSIRPTTQTNISCNPGTEVISCNSLANNCVEKTSKQHYLSSVPFNSTISKGWFAERSCDVTCVKSLSFNLQSCCFIDNKFIPRNTIDVNILSRRITNNIQKKVGATDLANKNSLVKLSKHKLVRKQDRSNISKIPVKKNDSSLILRTNRKLIRKTETTPRETNNNSSIREIPPVNVKAEKKPATKIHLSTPIQLPNEEKITNVPSSTSIVVLTRQKLIRKTNSTITTSKSRKSDELPSKFISNDRRKLIRSNSLLKNSRLSKSVLYHIIKQRRRPYSRSSYVLLTRNKLIRRAKFKQKFWQKQSSDEVKNSREPSNIPKTFVSVGKNKLIRKSLFSKNNKVPTPKVVQKVSPFRKTILARVLNSPSKRIQRFTNHLWRINLKYSYIRGRSSYSNKNKRYLNRCKNNRRVFKKKSEKICPVYRKKGICSKHIKKTCSFVHDPKYIALCQRFLRGTCESESCLLSHDLISGKVPLCSFYLNDSCTTHDCPFLHSKPDIKAPICVQFLRGYCELADKCSNWHIYACPEYKNSSTCKKGDKCHLPHRNIDYFENKLINEEVDDADDWRYFKKNALNQNDHGNVSIIPERQAMGILPDFIPL